MSFPLLFCSHFTRSLELQLESVLFLFMEPHLFKTRLIFFFYSGLATLATLFLAILAILQCQYDSFVAIHRPKRTRRIILLQSITDTLLSTLWLATFLEMLLISRLRPLYASDVTHATSLSWYFADGFAGISWYVASSLCSQRSRSGNTYTAGYFDRLLFLYTAWLLASSIFMFRTTRTGMRINIRVESPG